PTPAEKAGHFGRQVARAARGSGHPEQDSTTARGDRRPNSMGTASRIRVRSALREPPRLIAIGTTPSAITAEGRSAGRQASEKSGGNPCGPAPPKHHSSAAPSRHHNRRRRG